MFNNRKIEEQRFFWRTRNPYLKKIENKLLKEAFKGISGRKLLEVGCGTGSNLFFLKHDFSDMTGLDISEESLAVAHEQVKEAKFLKADARAIPFSDETFEVILMRDCLHHILARTDKNQALAEMKRVCAKAGKIVLIEPNIKNLMVWMQSLVQAEERGLKDSSAELIADLMGKSGYRNISINFCEAMPLDRLFTHFRFGLSFSGWIFVFRWLFGLFNLLYKILIPKKFWSYFIIRAEK